MIPSPGLNGPHHPDPKANQALDLLPIFARLPDSWPDLVRRVKPNHIKSPTLSVSWGGFGHVPRAVSSFGR